MTFQSFKLCFILFMCLAFDTLLLLLYMTNMLTIVSSAIVLTILIITTILTFKECSRNEHV